MSEETQNQIQGEGTSAAPKSKKETQITTVTLIDGRVVEFAGKRKLLKTSYVRDGKVQIQLDFINGQTRLFTIPQELLFKFAAHGAEQKLGDAIAGLADIDDAVLEIDDLIDRLYKGEWNVKREANAMAGTSVLVRALAEYRGKSVEEVKAFLANKTQAEKVALRNNPKIKPIVEKIEAEKAAKGKGGVAVDTDALLDQLA